MIEKGQGGGGEGRGGEERGGEGKREGREKEGKGKGEKGEGRDTHNLGKKELFKISNANNVPIWFFSVGPDSLRIQPN